MKKIIKALLMASILCISLIGFAGCENINSYKQNVEKNIKYYMIHSGCLNVVDGIDKVTTIISSKEELDKYIDKYDRKSWDLERNEIDGEISRCLSKYDEQFFNKKSLVLYYVELTSGSQAIVIDKLQIDGDTISIQYKVKGPEIGTCDMSGKIIVVEVDKNVKKIDL